MDLREGPGSIRVGTANERKLAKFLLSRSLALPEAMVRFLAGPPMTEQERFRYKVTESRVKADRLGQR